MRKVVGVIVALIAVGALIAVVVATQKDDTTGTDSNTDQGSSSNNSEANTEGQSSDGGAENGDTVATDKIAIEDFVFTPETITVKKGTTVTWTNNDSVEHTVTGDNGGPDSELFGQGESYSYTFNEVGTFTYFCQPHPNMTGKVIVEE